MAEKKIAKVTFAAPAAEYFGRVSIELKPGEQFVGDVAAAQALAAADPRITVELVDESVAAAAVAANAARVQAELDAKAAASAPAATTTIAEAPEDPAARTRRVR